MVTFPCTPARPGTWYLQNISYKDKRVKLESKEDRLVVKEDVVCEGEQEALKEVRRQPRPAAQSSAQRACGRGWTLLSAHGYSAGTLCPGILQRAPTHAPTRVPLATHACAPRPRSHAHPALRSRQTEAGSGWSNKLRRLGDFSVCDEAGIVEPVESVEYCQGKLFLSGEAQLGWAGLGSAPPAAPR